jgi:hypothetical protein
MSNPFARATLILLALSAGPACPAGDDPRSAAGLVEACRRFLAEDNQDWHWAWCAGTLHGVHAFFQAVPANAAPACPPQDATVERFAEILVGFGQRHPERLAEPGVPFALAALADSFACAGPGEIDRLTPAARQLVLRGIQQRLAELGYDVEPNGYLGPRTSAAIGSYRRDRGLGGGEEIDESLFERLMLRSTPAGPPPAPAKPAKARKPRGTDRD